MKLNQQYRDTDHKKKSRWLKMVCRQRILSDCTRYRYESTMCAFLSFFRLFSIHLIRYTKMYIAIYSKQQINITSTDRLNGYV